MEDTGEEEEGKKAEGKAKALVRLRGSMHVGTRVFL